VEPSLTHKSMHHEFVYVRGSLSSPQSKLEELYTEDPVLSGPVSHYLLHASLKINTKYLPLWTRITEHAFDSSEFQLASRPHTLFDP
jgi:hypothetical protein